MSERYSELYPVNIGNKFYHLQALDKPDETIFLLRRSGKSICKITIDESGQWQHDDSLNDNEFKEAVKWIEELFM